MQELLVYSVDLNPNTFSKQFIEIKPSTKKEENQKLKPVDKLSYFINYIQSNYSNTTVLNIGCPNQTNSIGKKLSANTLKTKVNNQFKTVEAIFESSKIYNNGSQNTDLLNSTHTQIISDTRRINKKGDLLLTHTFDLDGNPVKTKYRNSFFDFTYCKALNNQPKLVQQLINYNVFINYRNNTDSITNPARSCSIFVSLYHQNLLQEALTNIHKFEELVYSQHNFN